MRNRRGVFAMRRTVAAVLSAAAVAGSALATLDATGAQAASTPAPVHVSESGAPYAQNPTNPLVGGTWAVNNGYWDGGSGYFTAWQRATGTTKTYLGRIASRPTALWFTSNNANPAKRPTAVSSYISRVQNGDPNALVQMALFGIFSVQGGERNKTKALTAKQITAYRTWIRGVSRQIGGSRVALIMEPDQALLFNRPTKPKRQWTGGAWRRRTLVAWATKYLHDHNPRAAVYLDAGDADWLNPSQAAYLLTQTGVAYARGFALGATHYTSTSANIAHGAAIVAALAAKGVAGRHFVIDTADNGHPFTMTQFYAKHPKSKGGFFDNSWPCRSAQDTVCNALGIRPTWKVAQDGLGLTAADEAVAQQHVDGYLWFGRPWLINQASPFNRAKAVNAAKYSPFQY